MSGMIFKGGNKMKKYHEVKDILFSEEEMSITVDDKQYKFNISKISERLKNARRLDRENYVISSSGYGIHWPTIDEDLSIDGLLEISHKYPDRKREIVL